MGPQKQGFWPKINCSQMKLPKLGIILVHNKVVQKLKLSKNVDTKSCSPNPIQLKENNFWHSKLILTI